MTININPEHRGEFTRKAKRAKMSVQQYANHVLRPGSRASAKTREQAAFAAGREEMAGRTMSGDHGRTSRPCHPCCRGSGLR